MRSVIAIRIWSRRCRSRRQSSGTCRTCSRARTASGSLHGCASRALLTLFSSPIPAPKRWNARSRSRASITPPRAIPSAIASSPSTARFTAGHLRRWPRPAPPNISRALGPLMDGFDQVTLGDLEAVKKAIGPHTAGILIEPLQGEGGVRAAPHAFFKALRQLCDDNGLLLILDEVQTGMGRTGDLFAYKRLGVTPDVMPLSKALGGGFPIGACLATAEAAAGMTPGSHGSTFGGNPLAIAAANAVLDVMLEPGFFEHVRKMSLLLKQKLASVVDRHPKVLAEVRGEGLLIGLKAVVPSGDLVTALRAQKLLTVGAGENVVRFLPPLIVTEAEIEESVARLGGACAALFGGQAKRGGGERRKPR